LPYIAQEYLKESTQLCVVRTLGFSGYNAGPAWLITGTDSTGAKKYVIAVLRARGSYGYRAEYASTTDGECSCQSAYDSMTFNVGELKTVIDCSAPKSYNMSAVSISEYYSINSDGTQCTSYSLSKGETNGFSASYGDLGRFTINCIVGTSDDGDVPVAGADNVESIPVSLNKADKDYILKVLGTSNDDGDMPLYVESLYDVAWEDLVLNEGFDRISDKLTAYNVGYVADYCGLDAVTGILTKNQVELKKKDIGKRYLYVSNLTDGSPESIEYYVFDYKTNTVKKDSDSKFITKTCKDGYIYTVAKVTDSTGSSKYVYKAYDEVDLNNATGLTESELRSFRDRVITSVEANRLSKKSSIVYNYEDGLYYKNSGIPADELDSSKTGSNGTFNFTGKSGNVYVRNSEYYVLENYSTSEEIKKNLDGTWTVSASTTYCLHDASKSDAIVSGASVILLSNDENGTTKYNDEVVPVTCDLSNYKSAYRYSSTPWVVSNAKGDASHIKLNKMFRFHTISDGASSIEEVKVSIENIRPDTGQFDVVVRSYDDTDSSPVVLESFSKCTMEKGTKFIGYVIGTLDGLYESKSKYITVEVAEGSAAKNSVPAGFLGYPIPVYNGATIAGDAHSNVFMAPIKYNTTYNESVNKKKQYFGISDRVGYDYDYFSFKGNMATLEDPEFLSHGFHLDCRLDETIYSGDEIPTITVDGVSGFIFDTISVNARTSNLTNTPIIASEDDMSGSIFEDVKLRKFTMTFAQGFDGWDVYRDKRTNTDEYSYANYKGYVDKSNGIGYAFDTFSTSNDASTYNIEGGALTSDYYSTLAAISLLKNPEEVDINLLALPGIDTINNTSLMNEVFDILEDRADTFAIVTTPDKESGAGDFADEISDADDVVSDLTDTELHSSYAATYYPWCKYEDDGEYIWLPPTRDIVRNIAESDNRNTTTNLAPAGISRGKISSAIRARKNLKLAESDTLYEANINPIRTFAQEGIVAFGQKTLREEDDLLNRIDVRRCVLRLRKLIAIGTLSLVFEPNDAGTIKNFKSIVNGILDQFVTNRAIEKYKLVVDESEEAKDRHEINATLYIKPIGAVEYINIGFVVTNNGAYFDD
jgi:hypothetical protein